MFNTSPRGISVKALESFNSRGNLGGLLVRPEFVLNLAKPVEL